MLRLNDRVIRVILALKGETMSHLSEQTGIDPGNLSRILAGKRRLREEHLKRIAKEILCEREKNELTA